MLLGVALVIGIELLGVRSLTFAVRRLSLHRYYTGYLLWEGLVRWLVERALARAGQSAQTEAESEVSSGSLYASGLDRVRRIMGLIGVGTQALNMTFPHFKPRTPFYKDWVSVLGFAIAGLQFVLLCAEADTRRKRCWQMVEAEDGQR